MSRWMNRGGVSGSQSGALVSLPSCSDSDEDSVMGGDMTPTETASYESSTEVSQVQNMRGGANGGTAAASAVNSRGGNASSHPNGMDAGPASIPFMGSGRFQGFGVGIGRPPFATPPMNPVKQPYRSSTPTYQSAGHAESDMFAATHNGGWNGEDLSSQPRILQPAHGRSMSASMNRRSARQLIPRVSSGSFGMPGDRALIPSIQNYPNTPRRKSGDSSQWNILVIGAPQVGKSSIINAYRTAVSENLLWPAAPVGICGFYGTTTVDPFPNNVRDPKWLCIDTPGRVYDSEEDVVLAKLFAGVPWKTRLAGTKSLSTFEVQDLPTVSANRAHQCIIVVPATDLIVDQGWSSLLRWKTRYEPAPDADGVVSQLRQLVSWTRGYMNDASPFVVVSKMDQIGGADNLAVQQKVLEVLKQCIPTNRVYFTACPGDVSSHAIKVVKHLDTATRANLLRLHQDMAFGVAWRKRVDNEIDSEIDD